MTISFGSGFTVVERKRKSQPPPAASLNDERSHTEMELGETGQTIVSNVTLEFRKDSETPLYQRVGALISRLKTEDPNIQILPSTNHEHLNAITEGKNVPSDNENFEKYFTNVTSGQFTIKFFARVQTNKRINEFKRNRQIFAYLQQHRIYMKHNQLSATDITAIAWIYNEHPDAISRKDLMTRMTGMLPSKFTGFQLVARQVSYHRGSDIKTRAWVIEMSRDMAKDKFGEFLKTFHPGAAITIVPLMDPKLWDKQGNASTFYLSQNKMLREAVVLKVDGLTGLDVFHEDASKTEMTLREMFLNTVVGQDKTHVMNSVSQFNSKRVCFLTTEANRDFAEQMIDKFLDSLNQLSNEQYKLHTFIGRKPVRIGKRNMPDEISVYTSQMTALTIDLTTEEESTASSMYTTPPPRHGKRSYIDVTKSSQQSASSSSRSEISGPTMAASQFSELDDKIKDALEQMQANSRVMEEKQQAMDKARATVDLRFQDLTDKLGSVVDMVKRTSEGQVRLQESMKGQQAQLNQLSELFQGWITHQQEQGDQSVGSGSPLRKKRISQDDQSMDESPSSQATNNPHQPAQQQRPDDLTSNDQPETETHPTLPTRRPPRAPRRKLSRPNEPVGANLVEIPEDGSVARIFYQNHHLRPTKDGALIKLEMERLKQKQVAFVALSETNNNWKSGLVKECFRKAVNQTWEPAKFRSSTSDWKSNSIYKPGGTVTMATGRWSGRVSMAGQDPWGLGRFSYVGTKGKSGAKLLIITLYRVGANISIKRDGPKTVHHQEWNLLRNKGVEDPNPRDQVIEDLISFIKANQEQEYEIILAADANENMRALSTRKGFGKLMQACQLKDLHADLPCTETHIEGSKPIDCILGSAKISGHVIRAGYTAFWQVLESDHRGLFIDIDAEAFYGSKQQDTTRPAARLLRSTDKRAVKKYIPAVKDNLGQIPAILKDIAATAKSPEEAKARYDTIDVKIGEIMEKAEETCASPTKTSLWSKTLKAADLLVRYWKARKSQLKAKRSMNIVIDRIRHEIESLYPTQKDGSATPIEDDGTRTKAYVSTQMRKAKSDLKEVRKNDAKHRADFLEEEAKESSKKGDNKRAKRLRRLANAERMKRSYARIRAALQSKRNGGVTTVNVTETGKDGIEHVVEIQDPVEVEDRILNRNKHHFKQAHETPFFDSRLIGLINDAADNENCEDILDGIPVDIQFEDFPEVKDFLAAMARPTSIQDDGERIPYTITREDVKAGFQKWKERTSTSPSGRHLGHYKTWIQDDDLLDLLTLMIQIPIQFGFAPERWCQSLNVMLEKDPGNPMIHRLRVIHLYEADFNWVLKQFWAKRMLAYGEKHQALGEEQHGSRRARMAIDAVMLKLLSYDNSRTYRSDLMTMDNDAKSCYDRILISLAMLASRRLGMPASVARTHAHTLRNMLHRLRTSHGVSDEAYSALREELCGIGQGSGAGPALWVAISIVLIECYKETELGMKFSDPAKLTQVERWLDAFVDDAELGHNDFWAENPDLQEMLDNFEKAAQRWERLLFTSGGALELPKCSWYCLHWLWDADGHEHAEIFGQNGPELALTRGMSNDTSTIERLEVTESHKTLGVRLEPLGIFNDEFEFLLKKSKAFATRLQASSLGSYDSLTFYRTSFLPGVGYSFPVVPLSFNASKQLQIPITSVLLNKISFNRNFPRAATYGPLCYGGLAIPSIYVEQGIAKIGLIMRHMCSESELGKLLTIALRASQLEAGVSWDILENTEPIPHMTDTWISALMAFMHPHDIKLRLCDTKKWRSYSSTCEHDQFIMDAILKSQRYTVKELQDINRARLFYRALTISDISTADGRLVDPKYYEATREARRDHSSWRWPTQPMITEKQRKLWAQAIRTTFTNQYQLLKQSLGRWTMITHRRVPWYYAPEENVLMRRDTSTNAIRFHLHEQIGNTYITGFKLEPSRTTTTRETNSWIYVPADAQVRHERIEITYRSYKLPAPPPPAKSVLDLIATKSDAEKRLLHGLELVHHDALYWIAHQWRNEGLLLSATDGSAPEDGTFGWIVALPDGTNLVECSGPADGAPDQMSSARAESAGVLSLGLFFRILSDFLQIRPGGKCRNYIDSTAALRRGQRAGSYQRQLRSRASSDMDLMTAYRGLGTRVYRYLHLMWVKGHQDKYTATHKLSQQARMNVRADELAEEHRTRHQEAHNRHMLSKSIYDPIPGQNLQLVINGFAVTQSLTRWIRHQISGYDMKVYLQDKHDWNKETWDSIDWYGFEKAIKSRPPTMQRRISKFVNGWWNTGTQRRKINKLDFILCPRCKLCRETTDHVLCCSRLSTITQVHRATLTTAITSITPDTIANMIMSILRQLSTAPNTPPRLIIAETLPPEVQRSLKKAIKQQARIGWPFMLRGYMSQEWIVAYSTLSGNDLKSKTTISWSKKIINFLWTYAFNMWDHRCKLLAEDEAGLKFTKIDNEIRKLYDEKDLFLNIDKGLFALPLARILARTTSTKQAHLVGMQAAKIRWEESIDTNHLENVINPTQRTAIQEKIKKRNKKEKAKRKKDDKRKKTERKQRTKKNKT